MMSPLERKKLELELAQVTVGKQAMEIKIMEREEEIERIKENIKIQEKREQEIVERLKGE